MKKCKTRGCSTKMSDDCPDHCPKCQERDRIALDDWLAEHVMEWHKSTRGGIYKPTDVMWKDSKNDLMAQVGCWNPTTDPAAAMGVLKRIIERYEGTPSFTKTREGWSVEVIGNRFQTQTIELAICLFAKKLFTK